MEDMVRPNRWNPSYFYDYFIENSARLNELGGQPLGQFIPDELPDGSKGITYGQVGARELSPRGTVRYLQVINIRDTGIDFAIKPDRVAEGTHNDPPRSRVQKGDILFTNTAFRGTETLIGRCVVIPQDPGKLNISQDIDRIRVIGVNPYYVGAYLKTPLAQLQMQRHLHGVDSQKINFGQIRSLLIPALDQKHQREVERQYLDMSACHDRAMAIKERLLAETGTEPGQYGEAINRLAEESLAYRRNRDGAKQRLDHLLTELVAVIEGRQKKIKPFPG
jgi:hypothetical protein